MSSKQCAAVISHSLAIAVAPQIKSTSDRSGEVSRNAASEGHCSNLARSPPTIFVPTGLRQPGQVSAAKAGTAAAMTAMATRCLQICMSPPL